jgi:hypothetical protein
MRDKRITDIVVGVIKENHGDYFNGRGFTDIAGNRIHVRDDGIAWETRSWVDYGVLDTINDRVEAAGIEAVVEYSNSYEVMVEAL